jgi:hypothetical protein
MVSTFWAVQFDFIEHHPIIRPLSDYSLASLMRQESGRDWVLLATFSGLA